MLFSIILFKNQCERIFYLWACLTCWVNLMCRGGVHPLKGWNAYSYVRVVSMCVKLSYVVVGAFKWLLINVCACVFLSVLFLGKVVKQMLFGKDGDRDMLYCLSAAVLMFDISVPSILITFYLSTACWIKVSVNC